MTETTGFRPELGPKIEKKESTIENVVFEVQTKPDGEVAYKSSAPDRKIILLAESSAVPEPGRPYKVKIIKDTNPDNLLVGKLLVEIVFETAGPIIETNEAISYLGVTLEKAKSTEGQFVPKREQYADFINDKEVALPLQRDIAVAFLAGEPMLVEGGTSLGKTTTVRKMAAELGWEVHYVNLNGATDVEDLMGRYIPNSHKNKPEDPEYIFADGKVTSGLRQEEGKVKVVILDEFNVSAPNILIRLHEVLDAVERGGEVILSEDASEAVATNKQRTKIIALMNPPGKGYFGREPLDPAQLRRWVYKKLPSELPEGTFSHATDALFGAELATPNVIPDMLLKASEEFLTAEQLQEIPGMPEILERYKEFHKAAKELLKNRKIAEDQPQPFTYDDRMEPRRVRDFILRFYTGDINETFQQALQYYYANKLESEADRKKLGELIRLVEYKPLVAKSKRKGLGQREKKATKKTTSLEIKDINYLEVKKLGLESNIISGSKAAERLLQEVINNKINITTDEGKEAFIDQWKKDCPNIPMPCVPPNAFWYLTNLSQNRIISNLDNLPAGTNLPATPRFQEDETLFVDNWKEQDYNSPDAASPHRSELLNALLGDPSTVNIQRQTIDEALWDGDPANRQPTKKHKEILKQLGCDPKEFEIRLIRQDEYARLAPSKGWGQKNLWTNFDNYFLEDDGDRRGLSGGYRDHGGPSRVNYYWRARAADFLSVRLVLSRKQK